MNIPSCDRLSMFMPNTNVNDLGSRRDLCTHQTTTGIYILCLRKMSHFVLSASLPNSNWLSQLFHWHAMQLKCGGIFNDSIIVNCPQNVKFFFENRSIFVLDMDNNKTGHFFRHSVHVSNVVKTNTKRMWPDLLETCLHPGWFKAQSSTL